MHANSQAEFPKKSSSWKPFSKSSGFTDQKNLLVCGQSANLIENDTSPASHHHRAFLFRNAK